MKSIRPGFTLMLLFLTLSMSALSQKNDLSDIPLTTKSPEALKLYQEGIKALNDVALNKSNDLFTKATELDPNFILPNQIMAFNYLYFKDIEQFKKYANKALASTYTLTESEILLQKAIKMLLEDQSADVTELGEKLVQLNPKSFAAHQWLGMYQSIAKNLKGYEKTLLTQLKLTQYPGGTYNAMGYNYMALNDMKKAKEAFENYLKTEPKNPNAYDSMGDYYAKVDDSKNATKYFMKAYEMDSVNFKISLKKAQKLTEKENK